MPRKWIASLDMLAVGGGSDYDLKLKEYKTADATADADYAAAKTKMETLKGQIAGLLSTQTTNLANKKTAVETKADEVERLIKTVRGKAGRAFKDFFDDLQGQAKDIRSLSKGANLDVLELSLAHGLTQATEGSERPGQGRRRERAGRVAVQGGAGENLDAAQED